MRPDDLDQVAAIESAVQRFPWRRQQFRDALEAGYQAWVWLGPWRAAWPAPSTDAVHAAAHTLSILQETGRHSLTADPPLVADRQHAATPVRAQAPAQEEPVIGHAILMPVVDEIELLSLAVAGDWQGQGLGRRCLRWLMAVAQGHGMQAMLLEVAAGNAPALRLYQGAGFTRIGERRAYYRSANGEQDDAWVMRRELDAWAADMPKGKNLPVGQSSCPMEARSMRTCPIMNEVRHVID